MHDQIEPERGGRQIVPRWAGVVVALVLLVLVGELALDSGRTDTTRPALTPSEPSTDAPISVLDGGDQVGSSQLGAELSLVPMTANDEDLAFVSRWVDIGSGGSLTTIGEIDGFGARFFVASGTLVETGRSAICLIDTSGSVSPQCGRAAHRIVYGSEANGLKYLVGKAPADTAWVAVNLWGAELWQRPVDGFVMFLSPVEVSSGEVIEWSAYDENGRLRVKVSTRVP